MPLLTFEEARESQELRNVLGVCGNSDAGRSYINKGTRMLMRRGNFWGTVQQIKVCINNECVTWPRYVGTILATVSCGRNIPTWNNWYSFVPIGAGGVRGEGFGWSGKDGGSCVGGLATDNFGTSPVFNQVPCGKQFYVRAYLSVRADIGKKITIFGIDNNGQTIRTKDAAGIWQDGVTLTLSAGVPGYASTSFTVREITRIVKDKTQGVVRLFYYDADNNALTSCGAYQPSETSPDYRVSKIHHIHHTCCLSKCDSAVKSVRAMVKLEFIPVEHPTDLVLIENLDALAVMIQSGRARDGGKTKQADDFERTAIREMNLELRDKFPEDQTPISINPFGTATPARHSIGRII